MRVIARTGKGLFPRHFRGPTSACRFPRRLEECSALIILALLGQRCDAKTHPDCQINLTSRDGPERRGEEKDELGGVAVLQWLTMYTSTQMFLLWNTHGTNGERGRKSVSLYEGNYQNSGLKGANEGVRRTGVCNIQTVPRGGPGCGSASAVPVAAANQMTAGPNPKKWRRNKRQSRRLPASAARPSSGWLDGRVRCLVWEKHGGEAVTDCDLI